MSDIYIGPIEAERKRATVRRKLAVLWTVYAMIVTGLACFALWTGDWKWNAEVMVVSWPLLVIAPSLAILRLFLQMNRLIKAGVERWRDILRCGVPVGRFRDTSFYQDMGSKEFEEWDNWRLVTHKPPYN
jgi:hypothetical protein